jgi:DNA-binding MarR family transcriptional regulator
MSDQTARRNVSYAILKLVMRYLELDKKVQNYGTNVPIYHAEVHVVSAIADNPGIHIRGLAEQLGMASASVSETVHKLEQKGLVRKEVSPANQSRLCLYVTTKGELAHEEHRKYHRLLEDMAEDELAGATDDQVRFVTEFLQHLLVRLTGFEEQI